jgi:hypothetical protein
MAMLVVTVCTSCAAKDTCEDAIADPDEIRLTLNQQITTIYPSYADYDQIVAQTKARFGKDMPELGCDLSRSDCTQGASIVMEFVYDDIQEDRVFAQEDIEDDEYNRLLFVFGNEFESRVMVSGGAEEGAYTAYEPLLAETEQLQDVIQEVFAYKDQFSHWLPGNQKAS